jgi:predicted permease
MNRIRQFLFRSRSLFCRPRIESELADEIRSHLEMATDANMAAGMPREEARYAALRQFGGVEQIKELYRHERSFASLDQLLGDARLAVRSLLRARAFTAAVLFIITVCLAGNVAIFSIVESALLRPLPFHDPGRLVTVFNSYPRAGIEDAGVSVPHYLERRIGIAAFEEAGVVRHDAVTLNPLSNPERVESAVATPSFLRTLGVGVAIGRTFTDEEGTRGKDQAVILSDAFWRQHFGADPSVIGRTLRIYEKPYTIVGVLQPGFRYLSSDARLWMPMSFSDEDQKDYLRHSCGLEMVARLRPGSSLAQAQAQLDALNERTLKVDPVAAMVRSVGFHSSVRDLHAYHVASLRPALVLLQTGALFLLLMGTVNLANLFMVRATGRAKEYSLRRVLGASRLQLARALLVESLLLSLAGGLAGIGLGAVALRLIGEQAAGRLPADIIPGVDLAVSLTALGASVAIGLLLALPVVWLTAHGKLAEALVTESRGGTTTRAVHRLRHSLIVAQITLAFVLLSGASLLGLSFIRVLEVSPGFVRENLLTGAVALPQERYKATAERAAVYGRAVASLRALPGVSAAALSTADPFSHRAYQLAWTIAGDTAASDEFVKEGLFSYWVSGGYFATLGIPIREGRPLTDDDVQLGRMVCVVDEVFARRHWPLGGALGHRIVLPDNPQAPDPARRYFTIVGVAGAVLHNDLAERGIQDAVYFPIADQTEFMVTLRAQRDPESLGTGLRAALTGLDPGLSLFDVRTMVSRVDESLADRRATFLLAAIFAGASVLLAAVGIYSVLACSVAQRTREIGVRMALGAEPSHIVWQFLGLGLRLLGAGVPLGLVGACLTGRVMASMLFGVAPADPLVLGATALALAAVAVLACLVPSQRAAHVAPTEALRGG